MRSLLLTLGSALTLLSATCRTVTRAKGIEPGMANHSPIGLTSERDGRGGGGGSNTITPFVAR